EETDPEDRHRDADDGDQAGDVIDPGVAPDGGGDAEGDGDEDGEEHGGGGQLEGRHETRGEVVQNGLAGDEGVAKVALDDALDVADVLDPEGIVETGLVGDALADLGAGERADHAVDRVAGDDTRQGERDDGHAEEDRDQQNQAAADVDGQG